MAKRISVVLSQGQSSQPAKRDLEENLVTALMLEPGFEVTVVPHLYDLRADGTGALALQGISGDMIVLAWMFERASRWTLDRIGVRGQVGRTLLVDPATEEDDDEAGEGTGETGEGAGKGADPSDSGGSGAEAAEDERTRVADQRVMPSRRIYCVDLRVANAVGPTLDEIQRIAAECRMQLVSLGGWINGNPAADSLNRFIHPTNSTALPMQPGSDGASLAVRASAVAEMAFTAPVRILDEPDRRWYPVIDFSRCTNCMECIDFCLFGVYGVDRTETILVEQPDNCRKGCPACSRVCPENAIMFPQHKTPGIAGAPVGLVSLKIDLSRLFGAPEDGKSAAEVAALERDEQLVIAGRDPVGGSLPRRQGIRPPQTAAKDDMDLLLDELDQADL